jgi:hypothetical protein
MPEPEAGCSLTRLQWLLTKLPQSLEASFAIAVLGPLHCLPKCRSLIFVLGWILEPLAGPGYGGIDFFGAEGNLAVSGHWASAGVPWRHRDLIPMWATHRLDRLGGDAARYPGSDLAETRATAMLARTSRELGSDSLMGPW